MAILLHREERIFSGFSWGIRNCVTVHPNVLSGNFGEPELRSDLEAFAIEFVPSVAQLSEREEQRFWRQNWHQLVSFGDEFRGDHILPAPPPPSPPLAPLSPLTSSAKVLSSNELNSALVACSRIETIHFIIYVAAASTALYSTFDSGTHFSDPSQRKKNLLNFHCLTVKQPLKLIQFIHFFQSPLFQSAVSVAYFMPRGCRGHLAIDTNNKAHRAVWHRLVEAINEETPLKRQ